VLGRTLISLIYPPTCGCKRSARGPAARDLKPGSQIDCACRRSPDRIRRLEVRGYRRKGEYTCCLLPDRVAMSTAPFEIRAYPTQPVPGYGPG